jgi:hypothetical protein
MRFLKGLARKSLSTRLAHARRWIRIAQCRAQQRSRMVLRQKSVCAVAWNLNGARSGLRIGLKLSTAVIGAVRINEARYLYPL